MTGPLLLVGYTLRIPLGGLTKVYSVGDYIYEFFLFIIEISAGVAMAMVLYGGVKYIMSGSNAQSKAMALRKISQAIIGLILLLGIFVLLYTINPQLTELDNTPVNEVVTPPSSPPGPITPPPQSGTCSIPPLSNPPWSDPLAAQMESQNGRAVIWTNANPKMLPAFQCFQRKRPTARANSVYRPPQYQDHLWEIRDRWCTRGLRSNSQSGCSSLKAAVRAEVCTHFGCTWPCGLVARSSGSAPHTRGTGIDIAGVNQQDSAVRTDARACCLIWQNAQNDPWHYNLDTACAPR